jgi:DNA-binding transcriptional MocR family regulator
MDLRVAMSTGQFSFLDALRFTGGEQPIYQQLVDAIAGRIATGELTAGLRLPPQRAIATSLGINLTTVSRALSALQQRGLVQARPGRGTVVAERRSEDGQAFRSAPSDDSGLIDLSVNRPATPAYAAALAKLLPRLPKDRRFSGLQDYQAPEGPAWARAAASAWLAPVLGSDEPGRIVLADGAQHALACVLGAIAQPGDILLADTVTYQGIKALSQSRGVDLRGLPMDRHGMLPDAFETACAQWRPRAVFLVPSLHNPTTVTLSLDRREAIIRAARTHNVLIIEDDVYGPLLDSRPPAFAILEPELTIHVAGFSKCVSPGLRMGFIAAPRALVAQIAAALRIDCWCVSPLSALVATSLLEEGAVTDLITQQKEELRLRQALVAGALSGFDLQTHETSTHAWLHLPEPWRGHVFTRVCQREGVGVLGGDAFAVGRQNAPDAVRINVGAARSREDLRRGLEILAGLLVSSHLYLNSVA